MASTNFRVFNEEMNTDRTFSDSEYEVATQRELGVIPGMANSRLHNKMYRQSTAMAKAVADFLVSQGYSAMDNDIPALTTALNGAIGDKISTHNTATDAHADIRTLIEVATKKAGLPVGYTYTVDYTELQSGQLALLGGKYLKSTYADLWTWVQTHPSMIVTETEWQTLKTASVGRAVAKYANVDDQYFRVPLVTTWVRGASSLDEVGTCLEAGLPNLTGYALIGKGDAQIATFAHNGVFVKTGDYPGLFFGSGISATGTGGISFDASKSNAIYGKSAEVQPQSVVRLWVVQAFGATSNTGNMDVAQVAQSVTDLTGRISTLESDSDFTIIYPNSGSKANPANVAVNSRYIVDNPFPGYEIECRAEIQVNGQWGETGFVWSLSNGGYGVKASFLPVDNKVILQTGSYSLTPAGANSGSGLPTTLNSGQPALCRVKVWKIGKVTA